MWRRLQHIPDDPSKRPLSKMYGSFSSVINWHVEEFVKDTVRREKDMVTESKGVLLVTRIWNMTELNVHVVKLTFVEKEKANDLILKLFFGKDEN